MTIENKVLPTQHVPADETITFTPPSDQRIILISAGCSTVSGSDTVVVNIDGVDMLTVGLAPAEKEIGLRKFLPIHAADGIVITVRCPGGSPGSRLFATAVSL